MTEVAFEKRQTKWDKKFLSLAEHWGTLNSKDPSTKVGAVIASPDNTQVVLGYNGFPSRIEDKEEWLNNREEKYPRVVHAEIAAANNAPSSIAGWTVYTWPFLTCDKCALQMVAKNIKRVVAPWYDPTDDAETFNRWKAPWREAIKRYIESGMVVTMYDQKTGEVKFHMERKQEAVVYLNGVPTRQWNDAPMIAYMSGQMLSEEEIVNIFA